MSIRPQLMFALSWLGLIAFALPASAAPSGLPAAADDSSARLAAIARRGEVYGHLMRARFAIGQLDYSGAAEEIHLAVALEPESSDLLIEAAKLLTLMHRDAEAERFARRALTLDSTHRGAMGLLAERASARAGSDAKSRDEAIRLYQRLADLEGPVDPEVRRKLAELQILAQDLPGAMETARRLVEERPGDRPAAIMLTELLLRANRSDEALGVVLRYAVGHPADEELVRWGRELVARFDGWSLADQLLTARGPFGAHHVGIQLLLAETQERAGRVAEACATLERALGARPDDLMVRRSLVLIYRKLGRMAEAVELISRLVEDSPDEPIYQVWLADTLEHQGNRSGALAAYGRALAAYGDAADRAGERDAFRQRMIGLYLDGEEVGAARKLLAEMERADGPPALEARARLAIRGEDWSEARQAARGLKAAGQEGLAALLEGEVAVAERRWPEAERRFAEAAASLNPAARNHIAELFRRAGRTEAGEQWLQAWVGDEPESADARYYLGAYLYRLDRRREAEREMREAFRLDPQHAPALNFLGYSLAERKLQLEEALELIRRALEIDGWNAAYLDSLGWVYYQMGRYGEARGPLERAARELPNDPTILEHLGDVYLSLGEASLAVATWHRALGAGPENPEVVRDKIAREGAAANRPDISSQPQAR